MTDTTVAVDCVDNDSVARESDHCYTNVESTSCVEKSTIPPIQQGLKLDDIHARNVVMETCERMLSKIEEIRTAVLHLQYSLHAGDLGGVATESGERSRQLWAWEKGGLFSEDVSGGLLEGALNNVFDGKFLDAEKGELATDTGNGDLAKEEVLDNVDTLDVDKFYANVEPTDTIATTSDPIDTTDPLTDTDVTPDCV